MRRINDEIDVNGEKAFYLLAGENDYLLRQKEKDLLLRLNQDCELETLGQEASLDALLESANMLSMFSSGKIMVQRNPNWLDKSPDIDDLSAWLSNPMPGVKIILISNKKIDKRKKLTKLLLKKNMVILCEPLKAWELPSWVQGRAKALGKRIDSPTAQALVALVGEQEVLLDNELKKMVMYLKDEKDISLEHVELLTSQSAQAGIFEFMDALSAQDGVKSLKLLDSLIKGKEPEVKILFMIARQFRIMLQGRQLMDLGYTHGQIVKNMGINPYVWKKTEPFAKLFNEELLVAYFFMIQSMDVSMKTGGNDPRLLLECFILDFCQREK